MRPQATVVPALVGLLLLPGMQGGGSPFLQGSAHAGVLAAQVVTAGGGAASQAPPVTLNLPGGRTASLEVRMHRGYPAFRATALAELGWRVGEGTGRLELVHRTGLEIDFREGSPWFGWEGELLQLAHEVYAFGDDLWLPLQVIVDVFPGMLPGAYRYDPTGRVLWVEGAVTAAPRTTPSAVPDEGPASTTAGGAPTPEVAAAQALAEAEAGTAPPTPGARAPRSRLVVIDAGHGGGEPGAVGPGGTHEKEIALAVALALARELESDPWIEVRLTRARDEPVPIWERGERATGWKGERPGVFVSIHANATPNQPGVRGFETYFLSEARTEHERRVAAAENAPLYRERPEAADARVDDPLLAGILRDLITHDHQHWSALLAQSVQDELATFHPGPNRGVKQGPFAVLTNALMPSVLVELGFITNRTEEALMTRPEFHRQSAAAIARAIRAFFDRYPPGGTG
jgi:N-acetylmuramoyl-L-alanine amidase